jgi:EamA domain-containing membrane protein RarD
MRAGRHARRCRHQFGACTALFALITRSWSRRESNGRGNSSSRWLVGIGAIGWRNQPLVLAAAARGRADVARLFYMVPAVTMVMAWALFGEPITFLAVAGMVLIAVGVVLARPASTTTACGETSRGPAACPRSGRGEIAGRDPAIPTRD